MTGETVERSKQRLSNRPKLILDAALKVIGQRGYFGFSLNEVAWVCGISRQGVLHHFPSKHDLLIALLIERDKKDDEALRTIFLFEDSGRQSLSISQVKKVLKAVVHRNSKQPDIVRLYSMLRTEALYEGHPAFEFFKRRDEIAIKSIKRLIAPHVQNPTAMARILLSTMGGLEQLWLKDPNSRSLVNEWDLAIGLLLPDNPRPR